IAELAVSAHREGAVRRVVPIHELRVGRGFRVDARQHRRALLADAAARWLWLGGAAVDSVEHPVGRAVSAAAVLHPRPEREPREVDLLLAQLASELDRIQAARFIAELRHEECRADRARLALSPVVALVVAAPRIAGFIRRSLLIDQVI